MGYKAKIKTILIQFDKGHEYHGAEVRVRGMSISEYMGATGLDGSEGDGTAASLKRLGEHLVSWNLEDEDGNPIPATVEALQDQDHDLVSALNNAWINSLVGVDKGDPLPQSSTSGEPSLVESVPMEALSEPLAS